jgi:hypothetical protein
MSTVATSSGGKIVGSVDAPTGLTLTRRNERDWLNSAGDVVAVTLDGLVLSTFKPPGLTEVSSTGNIRDDVDFFLRDLNYLRASRKRPTRGYEGKSSGRTRLGYAGEWTASVLQDLKSNDAPRLEYVTPPQIPSTEQEASAVLDVDWQREKLVGLEAIGRWLAHLGLAKHVELRESPRDPGRLEIRIVINTGEKSRDITEVGFGISQILPVLVAGLLQRESGPLVVDLPEAHLHPRPQALLADFFCGMALTGKPAIVETHSEMFFHRLRLRAAMNDDLNSKVAVYFFDPPMHGICSLPRPVGLRFDDELKWPRGFLHEAWETQEQIRLIRQARRTRV